MLMKINNEVDKKRKTHLSRINHVDDMRHVLLLPDSLAIQTHDDILCINP